MALLEALELLGGQRLGRLDPATLVREARDHGLSAVVAQAVEESAVRFPEPHQGALALDALGSIASALKVKALLLRVLDGFAKVGVVPVLLKGPCLSLRLFGDATVRATSDVDVLVAPDEVERCAEVLQGMGLSIREDAVAFYPPRYHHDVAYAGPAGMVELHYRAMSAFGQLVEAHVWRSRSVATTFDGRAARVLCPEDELVYLALHAANHLFQRLSWVYDLKLFLVRYPDLDWEHVLLAARESGLPDQVFFALELARTQVGASVPRAPLQALRPSWLRRAAGAWAYSSPKLSAAALHHDKRAWVIAKLLLADSRPRMALFLGRRWLWNMRQKRPT